MFQSYSAYTPNLARLNADFLKGPHAPDTILFNVESIEHHFAPQEDAASWPDLLTRYDLAWAEPVDPGASKSLHPRSYSFEPVKELTVPLGTEVEFPEIAEAVWVSIRVDLTPVGKIASAALYRPPMLGVTLIPAKGAGGVQFRLVPQTARQGFLLSPAVLRPRYFAQLESTQWRESMQDFMIGKIAVGGFGDADTDSFYQPNCTIAFSALRFEHQDLSQVSGMAQFLSPQPATRP